MLCLHQRKQPYSYRILISRQVRLLLQCLLHRIYGQSQEGWAVSIQTMIAYFLVCIFVSIDSYNLSSCLMFLYSVLNIFSLEHSLVFDVSWFIVSLMNLSCAGVIGCLSISCAKVILCLDTWDETSVSYTELELSTSYLGCASQHLQHQGYSLPQFFLSCALYSLAQMLHFQFGTFLNKYLRIILTILL